MVLDRKCLATRRRPDSSAALGKRPCGLLARTPSPRAEDQPPKSRDRWHPVVMSDSRRAGDDVSVVLSRQWDRLPEAELHAWTNHFRARVARPEMTVMVARDQNRVALAILAATIDDSVCAIDFAMATCHEARWALHDHLVRILIARRVRCLLSADEGPFGALGYPSNVQHYQHLLGYELRHVIPARAHRVARRRRRLVLVVMMASAALVAPPVAESAASGSRSFRATGRGPVRQSGLLDRQFQRPRLLRPSR
jgi:hypothetical protein